MNKLLITLISIAVWIGCTNNGELISLKEECKINLFTLTDLLITIQDTNEKSIKYGALYCSACQDYHTRASEAVLPFAVAYKESGKKRYLKASISTGDWLIEQQQKDGSWFETPSTWTGTTTDQLLMMASAYPILKTELSQVQKQNWKKSIKNASDWLVKNMNHEFASINYCATTTASLMAAFQIVPDSAYIKKADELAMLCAAKFDEDYFFTGEGNRIRGTKYGVDLGYSMDMSLWGLGLYAKLRGNQIIDDMVKESLKRYVYFIYPDGSTDGSWGVRASKWTTWGSVTADGCQILFSLYSSENPKYRKAAIENLKYLMSVRDKNGFIAYGPHYTRIYDSPPCNYPTFCRAKNLALAIIYGDQKTGDVKNIPTQKIGWLKYFKTMDLALVRTEKFMTTITGYRYKDIRRGADFKYMHRPTGGSITNLWVQDYGYLQASSQTEYHQWEMHYPEAENSVSITPRIEFEDENALYTNLYEYDSRMEAEQLDGFYRVTAIGELKDRNRWEGGVAYTLIHKIADDYIEKKVRLRFHGQKPLIKIIEPIIKNEDANIRNLSEKCVQILSGKKEFIFEILENGFEIEVGTNYENYVQPFPSLIGYPIIINVEPDENSFIKEVSYRITVN